MTPGSDAAPLTTKGEQTRAAILETALRMFAERGYEQTTMRAIAEGAGVSLGNAYYYFKSKEHLIQAFYQRSHEDHLRAVERPLAREKTLAGRLRAVIRTKIDSSEPQHRFAAQLFRTAADPESPLNPFSPDSAAVRDQAIGLFDRVITGSDVKVPEDLRKELPRLLWMWEMGIILFWIHDRSEGRRRTRRLADKTADLVARLVSLASNPLLRPVRRLALDVIRDLDGDRAP
jgi:AcrR family transcriptional regulator